MIDDESALLAAWWNCAAADTPAMRQQILPAPATADLSSGTISAGCLVLNIGTGDIKRHAGGCNVWEIQIGGSASDRIGFYGVTLVVQSCGANQAAVALGNGDGEIGGLTSSELPTQAAIQARRRHAPKPACALSLALQP
jgi:hypothetical protein